MSKSHFNSKMLIKFFRNFKIFPQSDSNTFQLITDRLNPHSLFPHIFSDLPIKKTQFHKILARTCAQNFIFVKVTTFFFLFVFYRVPYIVGAREFTSYIYFPAFLKTGSNPESTETGEIFFSKIKEGKKFAMRSFFSALSTCNSANTPRGKIHSPKLSVLFYPHAHTLTHTHIFLVRVYVLKRISREVDIRYSTHTPKHTTHTRSFWRAKKKHRRRIFFLTFSSSFFLLLILDAKNRRAKKNPLRFVVGPRQKKRGERDRRSIE